MSVWIAILESDGGFGLQDFRKHYGLNENQNEN
jgi:hypothetical protein